MVCQNAINTKIIPVSVTKKRESWYSAHELNSFFNIESADLRRYIKKSFLKQRTIGPKCHKYSNKCDMSI